MPYKNYRKKTTKRRKPRRARRARGRYYAGITRQVQNTFSDRQIVKLNYFDQISIDPSAIGVGSYAFRANDVFDPDYSGVGHQPMGFDQWGNFYQRWVVLGSKITIIPISTDSANNSGILTCCLQRTPISDVNINQQMEQKHRKYSVYQYGMRSRPIKVYYSPKKFEGVKDTIDSDDLFGTLSASPSKQSYFVLANNAPLGSTDANPVRCQVHISYIVMFKDPQRLLLS